MEQQTTPQDSIKLSNNDLMNSIKNLQGVKCEIIGFWIWATGRTFEHREVLKKLGFHWSKNKKAWYYNGDAKQLKSYISKYKNLEDVRNAWGSYSIRAEYDELNRGLEFGRLPLF